MKTVQTIYGVFDTDLGRLVGIAPQGVPDVTFLAGQDTQTNGLPVTATVNPVTGGIGIQVAGDQITGNAAPLPFASRASDKADNGQVLIASAAATYIIGSGHVTGFGLAAIPYSGTTLTITGASGVKVNGTTAGTVTRAQSSNSVVAIIQVAPDSYLVTGS